MIGGVIGAQFGAESADVVLVFANDRAVRNIASGKFTLGGDADVAAGPVGRSATAQTDATMNAKILSYSRSRGVFAGIALTGATLRQDLDENASLYGKKLTTREIVTGKVKPPDAATELLTLLKTYSTR